MAHLRGALTIFSAVAGLTVLAACGASAGSSAQSSSSASSPSPAPSTTAPAGTSTPASTTTTSAVTTPAPTGSASLSAVVLRPGDLPAGWPASAYKPDPADAAQHAAFLKCVGARDTDADKVVEAHSPDFSMGDAAISSDATRYKSAADLAVDTATLRNPKALACYRKLTNPSFLGLPAGSTIDSKAFQLTGREAGQPANVVGNLHADIVVTVSGQHARVFIDSVFIRGARIEAEVDYEDIGHRVPASLQKALNAVVASRAAKA